MLRLSDQHIYQTNANTSTIYLLSDIYVYSQEVLYDSEIYMQSRYSRCKIDISLNPLNKD